MRIIYKSNVSQIYSVDKVEFGSYYLRYHKGEKIKYSLPRWGRPEYYTEDLYRKLWDVEGILYTKEEVLNEIRSAHNFEEEHLFEYDGLVYTKPRVIIDLGHTRLDRYFNTLEECDQFIENVKQSNQSWIDF